MLHENVFWKIASRMSTQRLTKQLQHCPHTRSSLYPRQYCLNPRLCLSKNISWYPVGVIIWLLSHWKFVMKIRTRLHKLCRYNVSVYAASEFCIFAKKFWLKNRNQVSVLQWLIVYVQYTCTCMFRLTFIILTWQMDSWIVESGASWEIHSRFLLLWYWWKPRKYRIKRYTVFIDVMLRGVKQLKT